MQWKAKLVLIAKVDCDEHNNVCSNYGVSDFCYFLMFMYMYILLSLIDGLLYFLMFMFMYMYILLLLIDGLLYFLMFMYMYMILLLIDGLLYVLDLSFLLLLDVFYLLLLAVHFMYINVIV
ncbi:hypothetical protein GUJ93_ZPchr0011g28654 [Zizania palustris]|uniref:Uncharacterized protein n=1 Tax=Zizania palustris TaxID=103762 RepID=A0A8J5WM34_ZIZPA|nr:hypothetical protein GUJ93_ZPchr0011g28654 [Zizania palustris]